MRCNIITTLTRTTGHSFQLTRRYSSRRRESSPPIWTMMTSLEQNLIALLINQMKVSLSNQQLPPRNLRPQPSCRQKPPRKRPLLQTRELANRQIKGKFLTTFLIILYRVSGESTPETQLSVDTKAVPTEISSPQIKEEQQKNQTITEAESLKNVSLT